MSHQELTRFLRHHGIENFSGLEVAKSDTPPESHWARILPTLQIAERLRAAIQPGFVIVNSGYRSPSHNERVGGAPNSLHVDFNALDIVPYSQRERMSPREVVEILQDDPFWDFMSVGRYGRFVHIDTRSLIYSLDHPKGRPWRRL